MFDPSKLTILTVDDNDAGRYVVSHMLRREGFNVKEAATGNEALAIATSCPDLIILDVNLPDINGLKVCQKIKTNPVTSSIPVLQMSAIHITSDDKAQALEYGADGYMVSPISPRELIATVKSLIRMRQAEIKLQEKVVELREAQNDLEKRVQERTAELSQARTEAELANQIKDEFLATVSHELRTPLTAILGWARLLLTQKLDLAMVRRAIETIERNAKAQAQLIEDLLDISRIITGKLRIDTAPIELIPIIKAVIDSISPQASAKKIHLEAFLDAEVGLVSADLSRLQQIINNLLSNAIKFTPENGLIKIHLEKQDHYARIVISDNGRGISKDFLPFVFDRFRQADGTTTRRQSGLGLGLSIVGYLVELHGGTVEAFSEGDGKGATFTVYLPLLNQKVFLSGSVSVDSSDKDDFSLQNHISLTGLKVLVVDDEEDIRQIVKVILEQQGAEVMVTASVFEALAVISSNPPQLLISDIGLPDEDGYSLIKKVREFEQEIVRRIPAVALTAYARMEDRNKALLAGFNIHLSKPINPPDLIETITNVIERNHEGHEEY